MNRVIKFRAWDDRNKVMFHFFRMCKPKGSGTLSFECKDNLHEEWDNVDWDNVHIMQFTGLLDKNGKDIYEGDILRFPPESDWDIKNYSAYEVFFHDGDANNAYNIGYSLDRCHNHGAIAGGILPAFKPNGVRRMEVIGNVFENPELLKT